MLQKYLDSLLEIGTVKEGDEYVQGYYNNRVPVYGLYLKAKKDTILERVEIMAKGKFKLEADSENYAQEARAVFFEKLGEYLKEHEEPTTEKEIDNMNAWLYKSCYNYMQNLARDTKGTVSSYDKNEGYLVVNLLSLDLDDGDLARTLEKEVEDKLSESKVESYNAFRIWFNENKNKILTKKQLEYLENEFSVPNPSNRAKIRKNIAKRVNEKYNKDSVMQHRFKTLTQKIDTVLYLMESDTDEVLYERVVDTIDKKDWLTEEVYGLSFSTCRTITEARKGKFVFTKENAIEIREKIAELYMYFSGVRENLKK